MTWAAQMKNIALLSLMSVGMAVAAKPVDCSFSAWDGNPTAWRLDAASGSVRAKGLNDLIALRGERAAKVTVSARVLPESSGTNGWSTMGVALVDDARNYWHLALVQAPPDDKWNPGGHFFELCEMKNGEWLSQTIDKLARTEFGQKGSWNYGKPYDLTLASDPTGIRGEVRDAAGQTIFVCRFAFSATAVTCGRPGLHANGGFRGVFTNIDAACAEPRPAAAAQQAFPPYASDNFVPGISEKATGFFRVVQRPDGRWWTVDPLGRGVVLMGVDHVRYQGHWSQRTKRSVHHEVNKKRFPNKADWEADTLARLKAWGFNLLGAGCDPALERRGLVHTRFLSMGDGLCWENEEYYICPNEHRPCSAFPNVFHPDFEAWCDYVARKRCAPNKDDPWLFGYFIDNELAWWGRGASGTGLFDAVSKLPAGHSAKQAQREFLAKRGVKGAVPPEVKLDFLRLAAERYFGIASAAIRRHDPHHLVMGARFAGIGGAHDAVWEIAGKYCDLVTFNIYPWADLDSNEVRVHRGAKAPRVADAFAERYAIVKRPMLITEWSFPALDSGLPCTAGAGQRFRTQKERTAATELFAKTMLATPSLLGYDYFMWVDEPAEGISDAFPEDSNYGLINLQGEAYPEITAMFTALQKNVGRWRHAPVPAARPAPPPAGQTAASFATTLPKPSAPGGVTYVRDGAAYTLTTRGGLLLSGRVGAAPVFARVALKGCDIGSYNAMLCYEKGGLRWLEITKVTEVSFSMKNGWGMLEIVGEYRTHDGCQGFTLTQKISVHPDRPYFLAEITKAVNIGTEPLDVHALFLRQNAPYAGDKATDKKREVPNLWKAPHHDVWVRASDGVWWGGMTKSPACTLFNYFLMGKGQHPDASFEPQGEPPAGSTAGNWRLAPGASYDPHGTVWALCIGGTGGRAGWEKQVKELED